MGAIGFWGYHRERSGRRGVPLFLWFVIVVRRTTFPASNTRLVAGPFVGCALRVRGTPSSTSDFTLLLAIHRGETTTATLASFPPSALCHVEHPLVGVSSLYAPQYRFLRNGQ